MKTWYLAFVGRILGLSVFNMFWTSIHLCFYFGDTLRLLDLDKFSSYFTTMLVTFTLVMNSCSFLVNTKLFNAYNLLR